MRVSLFVDVQSLYFAAKEKHKSKIDYYRLLEFCFDFGTLVDKIAYIQPNKINGKFLKALKEIGFTVKAINAQAMFLDAALTDSETIVICSNSRAISDLLPYVENKKIIILGVNTYKIEKPNVTVLEIPGDLLIK